MLDSLGTRPAEQVLSRTVRITLGGATFELPVRSIRANREWKAQLDAATAHFLENLPSESDEVTGKWAALVAAFDGHIDELIDVLVAYDTSGVLSKDAIEGIEPDATNEVVMALREVWRAASPLVVTAVQTMVMEAISDSSPPTNTPPTPTGSRRRKSKTN